MKWQGSMPTTFETVNKKMQVTDAKLGCTSRITIQVKIFEKLK